MPTAINPAAVATLIERRNLVLNNYHDSPNQRSSLLVELGVLNDAIAFYAPEYSASGASLPVGAATDATIVASATTIKDAIDNVHTLLGNTVAFAETVWIDSNNTVYIRVREADGDIKYFLPGGATYIPVGTSTLATLSKDDLEIDTTEYDAKTNGTGWSIGHRIVRLQYLDLSATPISVKATVWRNESTGAIITAAISIATDLEPPPDRSAAKLDNVNLALGAPNAAVATSDVGTFSLLALIKRGLGNWTNLLDRLPSALVGGRLPVDGSQVTQPISAIALPLPAEAATATLQGTGNDSLDSIDTKIPTVGQKTSGLSAPVVIASDNIVTTKTDQTTHGTTDLVAADLVSIGGNPIDTGYGPVDIGTQRVVIADNSEILIWDGNNYLIVKSGGVNPENSDPAVVVTSRPMVTNQAGQIGPSADTAMTAGARIVSLLFVNTTTSPIFLGMYNSSGPLTTASVPAFGYIIRVPANSTLDKSAADFGELGRSFGFNTRIGLSATFETFTAVADLSTCALNIQFTTPPPRVDA